MRRLRGRGGSARGALIAALAIAVAGCGGGDEDHSGSAPAADPSTERARLGPCPDDVRIRNLRCGTVTVPKFRSAPDKGEFEIGFAVRPQRDRAAQSEGAIFAV